MFQDGVIFGHHPYGLHLFFDQYTYCTVLRDPVARVVSHYYYNRAERRDPNHALARDNSLAQWTSISISAQNRMTQFLAGFENQARFPFVYSPLDLLLTFLLQVPNQTTFELALHHLRTKFAIVGIQERWQQVRNFAELAGEAVNDSCMQTVDLIRTAFGWKALPPYASGTVAPL